LGQIGHERIHRREIGRIDELTAHAPLRDEAGMRELLQVKAERGRENAEAFGEYTGGEPVGSALDQQAKEREPRLMRERAECRHRRLGLHLILRYFDDNQIIKRKREASRDMSRLIEIRAAAAALLRRLRLHAGIFLVAEGLERRRHLGREEAEILLRQIGGQGREMEIGEEVLEAQPAMRLDELAP